MAESLESRKFERKSMFDVPLPMRRTARESTATENSENNQVTPNMMAFSLMTKRGNRQQVNSQHDCALNLPNCTLDPHYRSPFRLELRRCHADSATG